MLINVVRTALCENLEAREIRAAEKILAKVCSAKKFPNLKAYISVNFTHVLTNFVPQKQHIFVAF